MKRFNLTLMAELILMVFIILQVTATWKNYISPQLVAIKRYGLVSSVQRSEILTMERDIARYIRFLDKYIPKDSPVVLPYSVSLLNSQSVMQYYLFPRPILACCDSEPDARCLKCLTQKDTFVPALKNFPGPEWMGDKIFVAYPDTNGIQLGVYAPADLAGALSIPTLTEYGHTQAISVKAIILDTFIITLFFILGFIIVLTILTEPQWLDLLSLSIPFALGLYTWLLFIFSYAGIPINLVSISFCYLTVLILFLVLHYKRFGFLPRLPQLELNRHSFKITRISDVLIIFLILLAITWSLLSIIISIGRAYSLFGDIANWSLKGYAMVYQGSIFAGNQWGGHVLSYPLNLALSIGTFKLVSGDILPGSKILFPIFAVSLILGCVKFLRRFADDRTILLALLLLATMPLFFFQSTTGLANLPFTCYLVLGILWGLQGVLDDKDSYFLVSGILFSLAGWTRPEGMGFSLIMIIIILLLAMFIFKKPIGLRNILFLILPILVIPGIWSMLIGSSSMYSDEIGISLYQFMNNLNNGNFHFESLLHIYRYGADYFTGNWSAGYVLGVALIIILSGIFIRNRLRDRLFITLLILVLAVVLIPIGMFYIASYQWVNFNSFLDQSFDRALLPALTLLTVTAIVAISEGRKKEVR